MRCGNCGGDITKNSSFCMKCGAKVPNGESGQLAVTRGKRKAGFVIVVLLLIIFLAVVLVSKVVTAGRVERQLSIAERYLEDLEYEEAVAAYQAVIEIDPKNEEAYQGIAEAYIGMGDYKSAVKALEEGYEKTGDEDIYDAWVKAYLGWTDWTLAESNKNAEEEAISILEDGYDKTEDERIEDRLNDLRGIGKLDETSAHEEDNIQEGWDKDWGDGRPWNAREDILPHEEDGYIVFGAYEQDGDLTNGPEPIAWEVLDVNENGALLLSRYVLDAKSFSSNEDIIVWADCGLRQWLNEDFLNSAFTWAEQEKIRSVTLSNPGNPYYESMGGGDTTDRVFLLSTEEVIYYYGLENTAKWDAKSFTGFDADLLCEPTEYALNTRKVEDLEITQEVYDDWLYSRCGYEADVIGMVTAPWWLRSPGEESTVGRSGKWAGTACGVLYYGGAGWAWTCSVVAGDHGVRPALYISGEGMNDLITDHGRFSEFQSEAEEISELYDAFMRNEVSVYFQREADDTQQFNFKEHLADGRSYTLDEIIRLTTADWGDSITIGEPQYKYIDCGLDGVKELQVTIFIDAYVEGYTIDMIIKDIEGELWICYDCDSWSRSDTMILYSGLITGGGSSGAAAYSIEKSYVDKDGVWRDWYDLRVTGDYLINDVSYNGSTVSLADLDVGSLTLYEYTLGDSIYYCLRSNSGSESAMSQNTLDKARARLEGIGMPLYSQDEIDEILAQWREVIGLKDEVVDYNGSN